MTSDAEEIGGPRPMAAMAKPQASGVRRMLLVGVDLVVYVMAFLSVFGDPGMGGIRVV